MKGLFANSYRVLSVDADEDNQENGPAKESNTVEDSEFPLLAEELDAVRNSSFNYAIFTFILKKISNPQRLSCRIGRTEAGLPRFPYCGQKNQGLKEKS